MTVVSSCKKEEIIVENIDIIHTDAKDNLMKIHFVNDQEAYIVGGDRYYRPDILETKDGGATWKLIQFEYSLSNKAIYGLTSYQSRVYAAAYNGQFFYKSHKDNDWNVIQTNEWEWFHGIDFAESNKGFIVAGIAFGRGRIIQIDSIGHVSKVDTFEQELSDIKFINPKIGYASGYGAIMQTINGGETWEYLNIKGDFFKSLFCLGDRIWSVGYQGSIVHSNDGGKTWKKQRNGNNLTLPRWRLRSIKFKNELIGYAVGDDGLIIKTTDGGESWLEIKNSIRKDLFDLALQKDGTIWVVGEKSTIIKLKE